MTSFESQVLDTVVPASPPTSHRKRKQFQETACPHLSCVYLFLRLVVMQTCMRTLEEEPPTSNTEGLYRTATSPPKYEFELDWKPEGCPVRPVARLPWHPFQFGPASPSWMQSWIQTSVRNESTTSCSLGQRCSCCALAQSDGRIPARLEGHLQLRPT